MDDHHHTTTENCHLVGAYMDLIFEVRSGVADSKYQVEQLDHKVNLVLVLCSHHEQCRLVEEMATKFKIDLCWVNDIRNRYMGL
jgi:hypothetical protein